MPDEWGRQIGLDVIELGAQAQVSEKLRQNIKWDEQYAPLLQEHFLRSYMRLAGQRFTPMHVEYPADWWQAFKKRWLPVWALTRWPVRVRSITWSPEVVYPLIALPEEPRWEILDIRDTEGPLA